MTTAALTATLDVETPISAELKVRNLPTMSARDRGHLVTWLRTQADNFETENLAGYTMDFKAKLYRA